MILNSAIKRAKPRRWTANPVKIAWRCAIVVLLGLNLSCRANSPVASVSPATEPAPTTVPQTQPTPIAASQPTTEEAPPATPPAQSTQPATQISDPTPPTPHAPATAPAPQTKPADSDVPAVTTQPATPTTTPTTQPAASTIPIATQPATTQVGTTNAVPPVVANPVPAQPGSFPFGIAQIVLLGFLLLIAIVAIGNSENKKPIFGMMMASAPFVPAAMVLSTVVAYLLSPHWPWPLPIPGGALWVGVALPVIAWCFFSVVFQHLSHPQYAVPSSYRELKQRLVQLEVELPGPPPPRLLTAPAAQVQHSAAQLAENEARIQKHVIDTVLKRSGPSWIEGNGYIGAWQRLHRAEEALIECQSIPAVVSGAVYDTLRLVGSSVGQSEELLCMIRRAVHALDVDASTYLDCIPRKLAPTGLLIPTPTVLPEAIVGAPCKYVLSAVGGKPPYVWSASGGTLPAWLTLSGGTLTGIVPVTGAPFTFTIRVTDTASTTTTQSFLLNAVAFGILTTSPLPDGVAGTAFTLQLRALGGLGPHHWSFIGAAPAGLTLSDAGVLSWTTPQADSIALSVSVTD